MKFHALCLHREVMFSSVLVSACRGCAFLLQTVTSQRSVPNTPSRQHCAENLALHPEVRREKGVCLSPVTSVPRFCWLSAAWSTGYGTSSQLSPFTVTRTLLREHRVSSHPLSGLAVDPKHSTKEICALFLLGVFLVPLLLPVGAAVVWGILRESSLQFPVSGQAVIGLWCARSFVSRQVPEARWGDEFGKVFPSASTSSWSVHLGV